MLHQIKDKVQGAYRPEHLQELEQAELLFHYSQFQSRDALRLGSQIIQAAEKLGEELVVQIVRTSDDLPLFQYVGDGRNQRNLDFAQRKGNVTALTGHCSLWALVNAVTGDEDFYGLENRDDCLPVGGAFPVFVKERLYAVVMTSGLHNGLDHQVLVNARCAILGCEVPPFHGALI